MENGVYFEYMSEILCYDSYFYDILVNKIIFFILEKRGECSLRKPLACINRIVTLKLQFGVFLGGLVGFVLQLKCSHPKIAVVMTTNRMDYLWRLVGILII